MRSLPRCRCASRRPAPVRSAHRIRRLGLARNRGFSAARTSGFRISSRSGPLSVTRAAHISEEWMCDVPNQMTRMFVAPLVGSPRIARRHWEGMLWLFRGICPCKLREPASRFPPYPASGFFSLAVDSPRLRRTPADSALPTRVVKHERPDERLDDRPPSPLREQAESPQLNVDSRFA